MALQQKGMHGAWVSRWTFIMAATGSAVGLGNMWKFPYVAGSNGGGAFVLVYLACILFIGVPVMMAEVMLGRHGRQSPVNAMRDIVHYPHLGFGGTCVHYGEERSPAKMSMVMMSGPSIDDGQPCM